MTTIVDTPVWSLSVRRHAANLSDIEQTLVRELEWLITIDRVVLLGPIRQELLTGIGQDRNFEAIRELLRAFPDSPITIEDYELAAAYYNRCRRSGITPGDTDILACAVATRLDADIFTTDSDFVRLADAIPVALHQARNRGI